MARLIRSIKQYEDCTAFAVSHGSTHQMFHFVADAKKDIATLADALKRARTWIEHFRDDKASGLMPTDHALEKAISEINEVLS